MAAQKGNASGTRSGGRRKPSARGAQAAKAAVAGGAGAKAASTPRKAGASSSKAGTTPRKGSMVKTLSSSRLRKLGEAISKALPGWKLVETPTQKVGSMEDEFVKIDQGPSIADLKRKFLPDDVQDGSDPFDADDGRVPVRIRPEQGGDAKTADIGPDGKVTIVQG